MEGVTVVAGGGAQGGGEMAEVTSGGGLGVADGGRMDGAAGGLVGVIDEGGVAEAGEGTGLYFSRRRMSWRAKRWRTGRWAKSVRLLTKTVNSWPRS